MKDEKIRLQKYLSECGVASRRHAEELIALGKVKVNGHTAAIGDKVSYRDKITVQGKPVKKEKAQVYIMLNKPRGFITTMQDEHGRRCVADLTSGAGTRIFPIGRLDRDSEGILLLTNDGGFANAVMHPAYHIPKTYRVTVRPKPTEHQLDELMKGVLVDGRKTAPCEIHVLAEEPDRTQLEIIIYEGRNRQIRKMCETAGLQVARLKRTMIGTLPLGGLPAGKWRNLTENEVRALSALANRKTPEIQKQR